MWLYTPLIALNEYYAKSYLLKETDPFGHSTQSANNAQGLPVEIKDAKGGSKKLANTDTGLLLSYTDCSSKTSRLTYDERGRIKAAQDAAGGITRY
ncbi:RHS repeat domain-containing protein [Chitinibacter sp. ZOR0017]|uniref:RHS repeat domain-containing protein n=1 Tax=Chitinibacter sp. ZOR0017 TaxID=1339254 RepID=UPI0009E099EA|nr:RHS repeat domain-containing protein [Chitinibacter sp. ZOR0017]